MHRPTLIETPTHRWIWVGRVPLPLAVCRPDGSDATPEELDRANHVGVRIAGMRERSYATRAEAEAAWAAWEARS